MDISSYFPSDVMNTFSTLFLFVTSHNLGKDAKVIKLDIMWLSSAYTGLLVHPY